MQFNFYSPVWVYCSCECLFDDFFLDFCNELRMVCESEYSMKGLIWLYRGLITLTLGFKKDVRRVSIAESSDWSSIAGEIIRKDGVVVIDGLFDSSEALLGGSQLSSSVTDVIASYARESRKTVIQAEFDYQSELVEYSSYDELAMAKKTVINKRHGAVDDGFIDVFHIDRFDILKGDEASHLIQVLPSILPDSFWFSVGKDLPDSLNLNLYLTPQTDKTRGWHFDSLTKDFKVFLYLSDVTAETQGPYGYLVGSHKINWILWSWMKVVRIMNKVLGSSLVATDAPFVRDTDGAFVVGSAGTIVVSFQNGIHRGHPRTDEGYRVVLCQHFA